MHRAFLPPARRPYRTVESDLDPNRPDPTRQQRRGVYLLPNLLTTGCLACGFYAIVAAITGDFSRAGAAVFAAMIFDGLDGRVARWTRTESVFGKEYDSLADMVAFGLAPAIVAFQWGVERIAGYGDAWGRFGWIASFFYAVCAALRLARFNARASTADKRYFEGLPSPSAAAVVAAFVWFSSEWREPGLAGLILTFSISAVAGALMVSGFAYPSMKQVDWDRRVKFAYFIIVPVFLALIAAEPPTMLLAMFSTYALSAPLFWLGRRLFRGRRDLPEPPAA
ncbi:MAG: CDP-diacylglycerol--serine O-phosphatidyltransferase [Sinobacteraceae bacterium]|nr:CDP-diacylglycerol--serine O-phosphatidyltransferase [Nevskiaceae bacterium]MCP5359556.1 CDP-diacylglycerol--serine O-phosphatidyltransferase [Nevskiaceae bacterium]MCP5473044.1 CDP-diacylglycerol--serine O-phosphatidyltransferase [Nevskiaceae bacterium]